MRDLTPEKRQELATELAELTKQQSDALKAASLFRMTAEEARAYDERHERITELSAALATFRAAA
jgi:hypothetical protein